MLSFFSKKKSSPDTPTEEIIQGPTGSDTQQNNGDDFIFVEKKTPTDPTQQGAVYPAMPPMLPYPPLPHGAVCGIAGSIASAPTPYIQDVPFELAPELSVKSSYEVTQMELDGILAILTRQMSIDEQDDYTFQLERSIQNEVY